MISVDMHSHTAFSHALDSVEDMFNTAKAAGFKIFGFSEHSPRPFGYDYPVEYREQLTAGFEDYITQVTNLKNSQSDVQVLLGLEVDWFEDETDFIQKAIKEYDYDYLIAGVHFLKKWPFDSLPLDWEADDVDYNKHYTDYFLTLKKMAQTSWFNIAAHPDIIKIFSVKKFHDWLNDDNLDLVRDALVAMKESDMAMEISSAGLRKPCSEIYPCPKIMEIAKDLKLDISFASDAHSVTHINYAFDELEKYAASYGYTKSCYFVKKQKMYRDFI